MAWNTRPPSEVRANRPRAMSPFFVWSAACAREISAVVAPEEWRATPDIVVRVDPFTWVARNEKHGARMQRTPVSTTR